MCITTGVAKLSDTLLYAGEGTYKGRYVHVIAYQNQANSPGANAMLIPFPAAEEMTEENVIDTRPFGHFLRDIMNPLKERGRGPITGIGMARRRARVFDVGSYTVVLAKTIRDVPDATSRVPENKRPRLSASFVGGFEKLYGDNPVALCCWSGDIKAEPLLWWYVPRTEGVLFAPAMDAHDGNAPNVAKSVAVDHELAFGSNDAAQGAMVSYTQTIPEDVKGLLPTHVKGCKIERVMKNGDFFLPVTDLDDLEPSRAVRTAPGGATESIQLRF